jgi:hypothetical protein
MEDQGEWHVYTCAPRMKRKLDKILGKLGRIWTRVDEYGSECQLPRSTLIFSVRTGKTKEQNRILRDTAMRNLHGKEGEKDGA